MLEIQDIIENLRLKSHPEGGYYRETYRSEGSIPETALPPEMKGSRNFATAIYFLITSDEFSAFHKINQDETWHFYLGSSILLHTISPQGRYGQTTIGSKLLDGEQLQFTVPAGYWFAVEVSKPNSYTLAGCTVAPGFDFADFTMPHSGELIELFPQHKALIDRLTR